MFASHRAPDPVRGLVAGLAGGLLASWLMERFQGAVPPETFAGLLGEGREEEGDGDEEPATVKAAEALSEGVLDHRLTKREKAWAGPAVHYAFGGAAGAAYGVLAEYAPGVTAGLGLPFGAAFWLAADEAAVPALGLSGAPWAYPPSVHAYALASHLVYGLAAEGVRRSVRARLG
jgi:uncharacterized membrane protein YagU involved in acid resistance